MDITMPASARLEFRLECVKRAIVEFPHLFLCDERKTANSNFWLAINQIPLEYRTMLLVLKFARFNDDITNQGKEIVGDFGEKVGKTSLLPILIPRSPITKDMPTHGSQNRGAVFSQGTISTFVQDFGVCDPETNDDQVFRV